MRSLCATPIQGLLNRAADELSQEVVNTITSAGAPSTRHAYALKLNLFVEWCSSHRIDAGSAQSESYCPFFCNGWKHDWVIRFLRGVRRLNPPRPPSIPSWDLSLVLRALQQGPFDPCKQTS